MAVQFNLLPEVKLEYVKARRTKYLLTFVSIVVGGVALAIFLFSFFFVSVVQKKSLSDLNTDIAMYKNDLKKIKNLDKVLTVQNQLGTLTNLHEEKPVAGRLFGYITQVTPVDAKLEKLNIDFTTKTMSIAGKASSLDSVSVFTDTLKATRYDIVAKDAATPSSDDICPNVPDAQQTMPRGMRLDEKGDCVEAPKAFSKVVLSAFSRDDKGANFTVTLEYDEALFKVVNNVKLLVPRDTPTSEINFFKGRN